MISRKQFLIANWKMNHSRDSLKAYLDEFLNELSAPIETILSKVGVVIAPPVSLLHEAQSLFCSKGLFLASQNIFWEESGAYTGEVSAAMVKDAGASYTLIGHSERRQYFHEINLNVENGVAILKQYYHCDTMFRAQGFLWLCNEIKDIEYEEI